MNTERKIYLASESVVKVAALKRALDTMAPVPAHYIVLPKPSSSLVPNQPVGYEEIMAGCLNRARSISGEINRDSWKVAIENGIVELLSGEYADIGMVMFYKNESEYHYAYTLPVLVPNDVSDIALATEGRVRTVGQIMVDMGTCRDHSDPHKALCDISRVDLLRQAISILVRKVL